MKEMDIATLVHDLQQVFVNCITNNESPINLTQNLR